MPESIIAVLGAGLLDKGTINPVGPSGMGGPRLAILPDFWALFFTDTKLIAVDLAKPDEIDQSIKRRTKEYEAAIVALCNEKVNELREKPVDDILKSNSENFSMNNEDITYIKLHSFGITNVEVGFKTGSLFRRGVMKLMVLGKTEGFDESLRKVSR